MSTSAGWRPLRKQPRAGTQRLGTSAFSRLALVHGLAVAGDTLVTMALAGSIFFSIDPQAARNRVALYLLLTMAPFAVVAPLLGPALDRSRKGRRTVLTASAASRAVVCLSMAGHLKGLWLFPEAFAVLVLSKSHMITKSALVPSTVEGEAELVGANSRLAILSVMAGFAAAVPGLIVLKIGVLGAPWVVRLAAVAFAAAAVAGVGLMRSEYKHGPAPAANRRASTASSGKAEADGEAELHAASVRMSVTVMAVLRAIVGFLTFLVAFAFRRGGAPSWWFGCALAASMAGSFVGAAVAPRLRKMVVEERMLLGSILLVGVVGLLAGRMTGLAAAAAVAGAIGLAAAAGKLAFDSIVQRDAPDAVRGRTFARFETRFQIAWVLGAAMPVVFRMPMKGGMDLIGFAALLTFLAYYGALVAADHRGRHFTAG